MIVVNEETKVVNRTLRVSNWFAVIGPVGYLQDVRGAEFETRSNINPSCVKEEDLNPGPSDCSTLVQWHLYITEPYHATPAHSF